MKHRYSSYTEELEAYNEAVRYAEREARLNPSDGTNRSRLQKKLDTMSLAEGWDYKTAHDLKNRLYYDGEESRKARESLETGSYRVENPYRDGGEAIMVGDYIWDDYGFLTTYKGWYSDCTPIINSVLYSTITEARAIEIAEKDGKRLFRKVKKTYTEIGVADEVCEAIAS